MEEAFRTIIPLVDHPFTKTHMAFMADLGLQVFLLWNPIEKVAK
jgi:hypothetical protein